MSKARDFIRYLESHIGDAYVWGAQGQALSSMSAKELEAFLARREEEPANRDRVRRFMSKTDKKPLYAFDCSGLILYYLQDIMGWLSSDTNANGLYKQCANHTRGELSGDTPLKAGCFLFRDDGEGRKTHVGVYAGGGEVIEAKGRDYGVVKEGVSRSRWTHYGIHPLIGTAEEENALPDAIEVQAEVGGRLYKGRLEVQP